MMNSIYDPIRRYAVIFLLGITSAFVCTVFSGCSGGKRESGKMAAPAVGDAGTADAGDFPAITVPQMIASDKEALEYMLENYWNGFLSSERLEKINKAGAGNRQVLGVDSVKFDRAFAEYVYLLDFAEKNVPQEPDLRNRSVEKLFRAADSLYAMGEKTFLLRLMDLGERYLYYPSSPFLNEELYIPFVDNILALRSLDSLSKMPYEYQSRIVHLNRKGYPAGDFEFAFMDESGTRRERLYDLKADYLLLYFNNPDCHSCKIVSEKIRDIPVLREMTRQGKLKVVSMYIDTDLDLWKRYAGNYPDNWIYAYDPLFILRENGIYGLRAIPSLYLLDKDKRVILKDAQPEVVAEELEYRSDRL